MTRPDPPDCVLTHPIQYYAPWFRHMQAHAPEIALTVVYATQPTPEQQGVGFDRAFEWDVPLTDGYRSITVRPAQPGDRIDSSHFTGLDVPEIGGAIAATRPDVVMIPGWYSLTLVRALLSVPASADPDALSRRLASRERPTGLDACAVVAEDMAPAAAVRRLSLPGRRVDDYLAWFGVPDYRIFRMPHAVDNEIVRGDRRRRTAAPRHAPRRAGGSASPLTPSSRCSSASCRIEAAARS